MCSSATSEMQFCAQVTQLYGTQFYKMLRGRSGTRFAGTGSDVSHGGRAYSSAVMRAAVREPCSGNMAGRIAARAGFALVLQELAAAGEVIWFANSYWFCCFLASIFFSSSST